MVRTELRARQDGGIRQWMWMSVGGGDGFQNAIDPTDYNIFYTESQNAGIKRYDMNTGEPRNIKPNSAVVAAAAAAVVAALGRRGA